MKTVTIPIGFHPLEITVNNTKYVYREGETVSVPDEVAALVEQYKAAQPVPKPNSLIDNLGLAFQRSDKGKAFKVKDDGTDVEWGEASGGGSGLPEISAGDAGKVLTVNEDETGAEWAESSGGGALVVHGTWATSAGGTDYCTLDKTAGDILTAYRAGKHVVIDESDDGHSMIYTLIAAYGTDGEYGFAVFDGEDDMEFLALSLDGYPTTDTGAPVG